MIVRSSHLCSQFAILFYQLLSAAITVTLFLSKYFKILRYMPNELLNPSLTPESYSDEYRPNELLNPSLTPESYSDAHRPNELLNLQTL